jgi:hypothetical protein
MSENTREALEDALGQVPRDVLTGPGKILVSWRSAAYLTADGNVTVRNIFRGASCVSSRLLDVAGMAVTGDDGTVEVSVNAQHCLDVPPEAGGSTLAYDEPVSVVATVHGERPAIVAVETRTGPGADNRPQDLFVTVRSWGPGGDPLGGVRVYWRVLVPISATVG